MAAIATVFTIARVAEMLGENEDWLHDIAACLKPEDGCLWVYDTDEREIMAFTAFGIECLQELIADERTTGTTPASEAKP